MALCTKGSFRSRKNTMKYNYEIVLKITIMFEERKRKELEGKNGNCDKRMINEINDLNLHKRRYVTHQV